MKIIHFFIHSVGIVDLNIWYGTRPGGYEDVDIDNVIDSRLHEINE